MTRIIDGISSQPHISFVMFENLRSYFLSLEESQSTSPLEIFAELSSHKEKKITRICKNGRWVVFRKKMRYDRKSGMLEIEIRGSGLKYHWKCVNEAVENCRQMGRLFKRHDEALASGNGALARRKWICH